VYFEQIFGGTRFSAFSKRPTTKLILHSKGRGPLNFSLCGTWSSDALYLPIRIQKEDNSQNSTVYSNLDRMKVKGRSRVNYNGGSPTSRRAPHGIAEPQLNHISAQGEVTGDLLCTSGGPELDEGWRSGYEMKRVYVIWDKVGGEGAGRWRPVGKPTWLKGVVQEQMSMLFLIFFHKIESHHSRFFV